MNSNLNPLSLTASPRFFAPSPGEIATVEEAAEANEAADEDSLDDEATPEPPPARPRHRAR